MERDQALAKLNLLFLEDVTEGTLLESLDLDSLDKIKLTMDIEDEFNVLLSAEELTACRTVGGLADRLLKR